MSSRDSTRSWRGTDSARADGVSLPWWCMATVPELDPPAVAELGARLRENIARAVKAPGGALRDVLVALFAEGHVLIEDYPGVGKTALARALARSVDAEYARIQCTADLLPGRRGRHERLQPAREPLRVPPRPGVRERRARRRGQPRLAEDAVGPARVHAGAARDRRRHTHELARPFIVVATQNPVEYEGTYPLPEAQLDRFMVRVSLGYPSAHAGEPTMLARPRRERPRARPRARGRRRRASSPRRPPPRAVHGSEALRRYVVAMLDATRARPARRARREPARRPDAVPAAKALAALDGRDHALPDDVQELAGAVLTHRLLLAPGAGRRRARRRRARRAGAGSRALTRLMLRPRLLTALLGLALCLAGARSTRASLYVPGVALIVLGAGRGRLGRAGRPGRDRRCAMPGPHTVVEDEPYPLARGGPQRAPAAARRRADRAAARLARAGRRALVDAACGSTCASPAAAGACSSPAGS